MTADVRLHCLPPVINEASTVLILGSMPGAASLRKQQYYANPRNHFWPILSRLFGEDLPLDYTQRLELALRNRIALWDVLHSCTREGSLDMNIKNEQANSFVELYRSYPGIRAVLFNGTKAEQSYKRHVGQTSDRIYMRLPSSSAVPGKYNKSLLQKIEDWRILLQLLARN